jgi:type II secretory pathway pseudopilin PulG
MAEGLRLPLSERGVSLVETLVALFILGIVGVAIIAGAFTSIIGSSLTRTRLTAESLARIELEYVSSQPFKTSWSYSLPGGAPSYPSGWRAPLTFPVDYSNGYSITVAASEAVVTGKGTSSKQKITAEVRYNKSPTPNSPVVTIVTYQTQ